MFLWFVFFSATEFSITDHNIVLSGLGYSNSQFGEKAYPQGMLRVLNVAELFHGMLMDVLVPNHPDAIFCGRGFRIRTDQWVL